MQPHKKIAANAKKMGSWNLLEKNPSSKRKSLKKVHIRTAEIMTAEHDEISGQFEIFQRSSFFSDIMGALHKFRQ